MLSPDRDAISGRRSLRAWHGENQQGIRVIEVLYAPTPNGWKVTIMLEECGLPYRITPIHFSANGQYQQSFLDVSPQ